MFLFDISSNCSNLEGMGVSALLGNFINDGFSLSVFPKPALSGPGREKRDVCDSCHFTK